MSDFIVVVPSDKVEAAQAALANHTGVILDSSATTDAKVEYVCSSIEVAEAFSQEVFA